MSKEEECEPCKINTEILSEIEVKFCDLYKGQASKDKCKELMEKRRKGEINYMKLIASLGISEEEFDKLIARAITSIKS